MTLALQILGGLLALGVLFALWAVAFWVMDWRGEGPPDNHQG